MTWPSVYCPQFQKALRAPSKLAGTSQPSFPIKCPCIHQYSFFFFNFLNLFFGCVGFFIAACGFFSSYVVQASHCSGFFCCRARALGAQASAVVARGLQSTGSVVVAYGPSCSTARGILPDQVSNPCPLLWQADSQPLRHQGSPNTLFLKSRVINSKTSSDLGFEVKFLWPIHRQMRQCTLKWRPQHYQKPFLESLLCPKPFTECLTCIVSFSCSWQPNRVGPCLASLLQTRKQAQRDYIISPRSSAQ